MAGCGIYDEVNSRQRETIFWACFVDVSEVDAELPLAVYFFKEYCHAPIPGPTQMEDPNRVRGARLYTGTLYFFFFFYN